jgi:hypothetical protein
MEIQKNESIKINKTQLEGEASYNTIVQRKFRARIKLDEVRRQPYLEKRRGYYQKYYDFVRENKTPAYYHKLHMKQLRYYQKIKDSGDLEKYNTTMEALKERNTEIFLRVKEGLGYTN